VVENSEAIQDYAIPLPGGHAVSNVKLDPDNWILKTVTYLATEIHPSAPQSFRLHPVHPNPFNASTTISFDLPFHSPVELEIYDLQGRLIWHHSAGYEAGQHQLVWHGLDRFHQPVPSGIYLIRLIYPEGMQTGKAVLLK